MDTKYIVDGARVIEVVEYEDVLLPSAVFFNKEDHKLYDSREDARYYHFIEQLESGKQLSDFKRSRYYAYYLERLKKENQEYLI